MTYTPQTWSDNNASYPVSATRMLIIENGLSAISKGLAFVNVKSLGALGDGTTDDSTAVAAAFSLLATQAGGRGTIFFPAGTYNIAIGTLTTAGPDVTLLGEGKGASIIQFTGTVGASADVHGIQTTAIGGRLCVRGLKLIAPTISNGTSNCTGVFHRSTTTGTVVLDDAHIVGFQYQVRVWDGGSHRVESYRSIIEGMGGSMTYPSMGIHMPSGAGAELIARDSRFLNTGLGSDVNHNHCIYIFWPVSYDISNCSFDHTKGRYLQCFDMPVAAGHTTDRPVYGRVTRCTFGSDIALTEGVITNKYLHTKFEGCTFLHPSKALQLEGHTTFTNCEFGSTAATTFYAAINLNGAGLRTTFVGCDLSLSQEYFARIDQANSRVMFADCNFVGLVSFYASVESGGTGSIVKVSNSFVAGGIPLATEANGCLAQIQDSATFESRGVTYGHATNVVRATVTTFKAYLFNNDFSPTGVVLKGSAPGTKKYLGNYGSVGLADA